MGRTHKQAKRGGPFKLGTCPDCGKWRYKSRKAARSANRAFHPDDTMSVYECGNYWHYGHPPVDRWRGGDGREREPLPTSAINQIHQMARREGDT